MRGVPRPDAPDGFRRASVPPRTVGVLRSAPPPLPRVEREPWANRPTLALSLLAAERERRSGVFEVKAAGTRTYLYFVDGRLVFAEAGTLGDTLGRVLVRSGRLTREQYVTAIRRMTERLFDSEQMRFGEVVVELGFLTSDEVREALALQVREKVIHCLMWEQPAWSFEGREEPLGRVGRFPVPIAPLMLAATKRFDQERVDRILGLGGQVGVVLASGTAAIAERFALNGIEQRFLDLVDGRRTTAELARRERHDLCAQALLAALLLAGSAELAGGNAAPAEVARAKLDSTPEVSPGARQRAEVALKRLWDGGAGKQRAGSGTMAALTPLNPIPVGIGAHGARLYAEDAYQSGRSRLREGRPEHALPYLRRAVELCAEAIEFRLCMLWADWVTSEHSEEEATKARTELWELANKAAWEQPNLGFAFYVRGYFAKEKGDGRCAKALFRRALELDPDLLEARRELRILAGPARSAG